jgi:hypothetical protein
MTANINIIKKAPLSVSSSIISIATLVEEDDATQLQKLAKTINLTCECSKKLNYKMDLLDSRREQIRMIRSLRNSKIEALSIDLAARINTWLFTKDIETEDQEYYASSADSDSSKLSFVKLNPIARLTSIITRNSCQIRLLDQQIQHLLKLAEEGSCLLDEILHSKKITIEKPAAMNHGVPLAIGSLVGTDIDSSSTLELLCLLLLLLVRNAIKLIKSIIGICIVTCRIEANRS